MAQAPATYQLLFEERPGYLYVLIRTERMTYDIACSYIGEVAARCEQGGHTHILIERDVPRTMSASDLFAATKNLLELMGGKRVAFVNPHEQIAKALRFGILVGTNRGAEYDLFDNTFDAAEWLLKA